MIRTDAVDYGFYELQADDGKCLVPSLDELQKPINEQIRGKKVIIKIGNTEWIEIDEIIL